MFTQLKQNFCSRNPQQTDVHIHALLKDWVTRNFSVNHFVKNIYPQIHPSTKPTKPMCWTVQKANACTGNFHPNNVSESNANYPSSYCSPKVPLGESVMRPVRSNLGSLCTNQFAQHQSYCTRSRGERFLCTPQFYIRLDAEIAGSCVVLLALFDSDVWDLSDSLISCEQQQWRPRRCRRAWL